MLPPNKFIDINKTYQRLQGKDVITTPKTRKSKRKVPIPDFLCDELREFISTRYMITPDERLFPITKSYLSHEMIRGCKNTGVKNIRIHDIRHSHASLHINQGCDALILADRLGHEKVSTTLNTYSHLFHINSRSSWTIWATGSCSKCYTNTRTTRWRSITWSSRNTLQLRRSTWYRCFHNKCYNSKSSIWSSTINQK